MIQGIISIIIITIILIISYLIDIFNKYIFNTFESDSFMDKQYNIKLGGLSKNNSNELNKMNKLNKLYIEPIHVYNLSKNKYNTDVLKKIDKDILDLFKTGKKYVVSHLNEDVKISNDFNRLLYENMPRSVYSRREYEFKRVLHWGQLKLILTEIEFLTLALKQYKESNDKRKIVMVYAGAAPGHHIYYLQTLFPSVYFELYDPNDFVISNNDKINIHVQFFTDKEAVYWKNEYQKKDIYLLFCSDIRTEPANDENVKENMDMQLKWWEIMKPELSIFKFRLPWNDSITQYLSGDIYIQPYPGPTSSETRLIVKSDSKIINYDNKKYEEQCYYHNNINRKKKYSCILGDNLSLEHDGIDNCYDCVSFVYIIQNYLNFIGFKGDLELTKKEIFKLIKDIQLQISSGSHNIYSQTIKNFNITLDRIFEKTLSTSKNNNVENNVISKGKSKATKIAYNNFIKNE